MRRVSTTMMAAVAALALLAATPMGWASGGTSGGGTSGGGTSGGGTSGGGTSGGGSGGGGGGSSSAPCLEMSVLSSPKISMAPDDYYIFGNLEFVTSVTNCGTSDESPTIYYNFTRLDPSQDYTCNLPLPVLKAQPIVPAGATVTFDTPWGGFLACDGDYLVTATLFLRGGAILGAQASDTFTFVSFASTLPPP